MKERDAQDSGRAIAPAIPAPDAIHLDNSGMSVEESVQAVIDLIAPMMHKL
jgi:cytidylate kinase